MIFDLLFQTKKMSLSNWRLTSVSGGDSPQFLQGQITQDIKMIANGQGKWSARLDPKGKLLCYFFIKRISENEFEIFSPPSSGENIKMSLERNLISEDVEISESSLDGYLGLWGGIDFKNLPEINVRAYIPYIGTIITILNKGEVSLDKIAEVSDFEIQQAQFWSRAPNESNFISDKRKFINETILEEVAISYEKGCFIGQETAAKIHNLRGSNRYPVLVELKDSTHFEATGEIIDDTGELVGEIERKNEFNNRTYYLLNSTRRFRYPGMKINFRLKNSSGDSWHTIEILDPKEQFGFNISEIEEHLVHKASELFTLYNEPDKAIDILDFCLRFNPVSSSALEALGVILGKGKKFQQAISVMGKLLEVDPESILAHSNLSVFYLQIGDINQAEYHKEQSIQNEFKRNARKYKNVSADENLKNQERQIQLFKKVLEIDLNDEIANLGLGQIYLEMNHYDEAQIFLERALETYPKSAKANYLWGLILSKKGEKNLAIKYFRLGRDFASEKGNTKIAQLAHQEISKLEM